MLSVPLFIPAVLLQREWLRRSAASVGWLAARQAAHPCCTHVCLVQDVDGDQLGVGHADACTATGLIVHLRRRRRADSDLVLHFDETLAHGCCPRCLELVRRKLAALDGGQLKALTLTAGNPSKRAACHGSALDPEHVKKVSCVSALRRYTETPPRITSGCHVMS